MHIFLEIQHLTIFNINCA